EVSTLTSDPPPGIKLFPNEEDVTDVQVTIEGPGEIFPDQNLPPQRRTQRGDLRQRPQEGLERRAGAQTRPAGQGGGVGVGPPL
uniref:Uncharacterized protein n=1 Tax=Phasianus colchicus TaxID=9054 RepID=A0A669QGT7_PHACC